MSDGTEERISPENVKRAGRGNPGSRGAALEKLDPRPAGSKT